MNTQVLIRSAVLCAAMSWISAARAELFWAEAEDAAEKTLEGGVAGWGDVDSLSGGKWFFGNIEEGQVEAKVPESGAFLRYRFTRAAAGRAEAWARVGYEFVRAPFDWRFDGGEWRTNDPERDFTVGCIPLADWCEVAWTRLGDAELAAGEHVLEIRFSRRYKDAEKKQPHRILFGLDCFVVADAGSFSPDGSHRPGVEWRTDRDRAAGGKVFELSAADAPRRELSLSGDWEYARWDETGPVNKTRTEPVKALPGLAKLPWRAIAVPGDRNALIPSERFAHRFLYRTRVRVPAEWKGGAFVLDVERANLISSVFVNGRFCASCDAAASGYRADVTSAMRPGEVNEIVFAFKDAYYAYAPEKPDEDIRRKFNLPSGFIWNQGFTWKFDYPTAGIGWTGLFNEVKLVASRSAAYADDVYVIPSVDERKLTVEVTVKGPEGARVKVSAEVPGGVSLPAKEATLGADGAVVALEAPWDGAELWSPENPKLYECRAKVECNGAEDAASVAFGFRQWKVQGTRVLLNGVPWQMRATTDWGGCSAADVDKAFAFWRSHGQTMFRMMHQSDWGGVSREKAFDIMDRRGIAVRTEAGLFDGQMALYGLREGEVFKPALLTNYLNQVAHGVRRYRNHASIFAWNMENEIVFINARNFGWLKAVEPGIKAASDLIASMDRQGRPTMTEGGRALMDKSLPVNGCHYEMVAPRFYPDAAYSTDCWTNATPSQPWPMDLTKPIFLNEEYFSPGNPVSYYAEVGGEGCFLGRDECRPATSLLGRMMSEGFRWQELGGWHFWMGLGNATEDMFKAWQPTCALVREWDAVFAPGSEVKRTVMVRNDNTFDASPITLSWDFGGQKGERSLNVRPGCGEVVELVFKAPSAKERRSFDFALACSRGGKTVFSDVKKYAVLPMAAEKVGFFARRGKKVVLWGTKDSAEFRRLCALGFEPALVTDFDALKAAGDFSVLVVGHGTLDEAEATDPRWSELLSAGRRVFVLEQDANLHYQATPADVEPTDHAGTIAFLQNPKHPAFAGLAQDDLRFWGRGHLVYRNAFTQPTRGADSLVQCGPSLKDCALCQSTPGDALLVETQLLVGGKLESNPVAARLFDNIVKYALGYVPLRREVAVWLDDATRAKGVSLMGLRHKTVRSAAEALSAAPGGIVVFDGTAEKLQAFSALGGKLRDFFAKGGYLMPWNVGDADLAAFNSLAGTDFILRPFRREKVEIPAPRDPLLSGLSQRDVTVFSGERIFGWVADCFVADDVFSGVVDLEDVAPFASGFGIPGPAGKRECQSAVNGFLSGEAWRYIVYHDMAADPNGLPSYTWDLAREERIARFSIVANGHYRGFGKVAFTLEASDGSKEERGPFEFPKFGNEGSPRMDFDLAPAAKAKRVTMKVLAFGNGNNQQKAITGIDNMWIYAERGKEWHEKVVPLLNVGGLVLMPRGEGGIILNQILLKENEEVPENGPKKRNIMAALLRNLGGVFAAGKDLRPGDGLVYTPLSFEGVANLYLSSEKGFFAKENDLSIVPCGEQKFQGVKYAVRDFRTSPLEAAVTLKLANAPDKVTVPAGGVKADALFFLQAHAPRNTWKGKDGEEPPEMYVWDVVYEDGTTVSFPQRYGVETAPWITDAKPHGISRAALAWTVPAKEQGKSVQLFTVQWNNPNPDKKIKELVLRLGKHGDWFGWPVVLGVSAAQAKGESK